MLQPFLRGLNRKMTAEIHNFSEYRDQIAKAQTNLAGNLFNKEITAKIKFWSDKLMEATEEKGEILIQKEKI